MKIDDINYLWGKIKALNSVTFNDSELMDIAPWKGDLIKILHLNLKTEFYMLEVLSKDQFKVNGNTL